MPKIKPSQPTKLLFIGNSFTQRNDLPALIASLALPHGITMQHDLISKGGAALRAHWNSGLAVKAMEKGRYHYVVLQEQSTLPIKNPARMAENVRLFDEAIHRSGSQTVLYMTWARQHAPETQQAITEAYGAIGKELGAVVVPVGSVWQSFVARHATPGLYDRDQSHPTLAGSYLAACVFLVTLWKRNPVGHDAEAFGLDEADAVALQQAAWEFAGK